MGWFSKDKKEAKKSEVPMLPELPKLPELPELPNAKDAKSPAAALPQLPSFPASPIGERFSQNNIKEAVAGRKGYSHNFAEEDEDEYDSDDEDNFTFEEGQTPKPHLHTKPEPMRSPRAIEVPEDYESPHDVPREFREAARKVKSAEPVFIRIDKFEESMKIFDQTKEKILEIEKMLRDIKSIKEEEEKELEAWAAEIKTMKNQIERVDRDIFSKV